MMFESDSNDLVKCNKYKNFFNEDNVKSTACILRSFLYIYCCSSFFRYMRYSLLTRHLRINLRFFLGHTLPTSSHVLPFFFIFSTTGQVRALSTIATSMPLEAHLQPSPIGAYTRINIWTEFIALANKHNAVNLGQGFPNTPIPARLAEHLKDIAEHPERVDFHQYTRGYGHPRLVNALAKFYSPILNHKIDPMNEVLPTVGAYLALYYSFMGWINPGDEVILFEPAFDSYVEQVRMAGGKPVPIVLKYCPNNTSKVSTSASFTLDIDVLRSKITNKTKMIVLNNPNNPTGKLYSRKELEAIAQIVRENPQLLVVSDEVYEFHVYPPNEMIRFASLPGMFERTITISSAGKAFSATGWKLGWSIAPSELLKPLKMVHENCVFAVPSITQEAVAREFEHEYELYASGQLEKSYLATGMAAELLPKRERMADALRQAGFKPIVPDGGYFIMADFSHLDGSYKDDGDMDTPLDYKFVRWLCREKGLATIPPSAFYSPENRRGNDHYVRICFFKEEDTLNAGIEILKRLGGAKNETK